MSQCDTEEYTFIEEEEVEIPDIGYETEWAEFGNIKFEEENKEDEESGLKNKPKHEDIASKRAKEEPINKDTKNLIPFKFSSVKQVYKNIPSGQPSALFEGNALFDGTFFTFIAEYYLQNAMKKTIIRKFKGKCELCEKPVYIVGTGTSTYNFLRHLRRKHGQKLYESYISYKKIKNTKGNRIHVTKVVNSPITAETKTITIYVVMGSVWKQFGNPRTKRPFSSIILREGLSQKILNDVHDFVLNSAWYHERSIPYKRTYLLHGPSGCGKTAFIQALAGELNFGLCVLHASDRELSDDKLNHLLNTTPENCIILLEDIGFSFGPNDQECNKLTLSGMLNCLDGVTAPEGKLIFMTTNNIQDLDPMLLRPGRVDVKEYLGYCSEKQITLLYQRLFLDASDCSQQFAHEVCCYDRPVTGAQLQEFFLSHKHSDFEDLKNDICKIWND